MFEHQHYHRYRWMFLGVWARCLPETILEGHGSWWHVECPYSLPTVCWSPTPDTTTWASPSSKSVEGTQGSWWHIQFVYEADAQKHDYSCPSLPKRSWCHLIVRQDPWWMYQALVGPVPVNTSSSFQRMSPDVTTPTYTWCLDNQSTLKYPNVHLSNKMQYVMHYKVKIYSYLIWFIFDTYPASHEECTHLGWCCLIARIQLDNVAFSKQKSDIILCTGRLVRVGAIFNLVQEQFYLNWRCCQSCFRME